ncbi:AraC-type DNA-binding protein [Klenkia soli]|uniref:AraC-type DNA-binding protein n=1 Tax=Klenkia soli TaxID=1052260 RepID=A0A1H0JAQ9_9ACTN|nr:helix-turn-helix domain-containing protein [Klenkia soli]SDO40817.1 AraC-type DNA-binding protein [Klenkia soli]
MTISSIDTATVAAPDRLDFWREAVCDQFVTLDVRPLEDVPSRGRVTAAEVGDTLVRRIEAGPHRFARTASLVRRADEDYLQIALARQGSTLVVQDGREAVIGPGDFVLYDSSRPFVFETSGSFAYSVCLHPKRLLPLSSAEMEQATAIRFDGRYGIAATVPPFLSALHRLDGDELAGPVAAAMTQTVGYLIVALVRSEAPSARSTNLHLQRAHTFVAAHLGDADLTPQQVADACAISLSYLNRIFRASGTTVVEHLREQRLQRCWQALGDPGTAAVPIGAVAARYGLPDHAHFCRVFRARFGMTPSARRAQRGG